MIAPEGIRDGRHFAQALYTFAGNGTEDLPFKKGDIIEVLDCADANWWRGKIVNTDEDGLFPACLVKFTNAPASEQTSSTAEKLAKLRDVMTPSYMKPIGGAENGNVKEDDSNGGSLESLLLNLANNEMQVQQQMVQAHMPRRPTRMKLLYEDHKQPDGMGRTPSSLSNRNFASDGNGQKMTNSNGYAKCLPTPSIPKNYSRSKPHTPPRGQDGLWSSTRTRTRTNSEAASREDNPYLRSFSSSIECIREATLRSEEASKNRASGSMLFGPRSMPRSNSPRPSSRTNDLSLRSDNSTLRTPYTSTQDNFSINGEGNRSYTSLYSDSSFGTSGFGTNNSNAYRGISEARQMMDGIPSPTENNVNGRHEAEYLFEDDYSQTTSTPTTQTGSHNKGGLEVKGSAYQTFISPSSVDSSQFVSPQSTVSSHHSVSSSVSNSVLSQDNSTGLRSHSGSYISSSSSESSNSSIGDISKNHRSWFSSTDSLNLVGGGGGGLNALADKEEREHAPKSTRNKSRIRPIAGANSPRKYNAERNEMVQYPEEYNAHHDITQGFQEGFNISATENEYLNDSKINNTNGGMVQMLNDVATNDAPQYDNLQQYYNQYTPYQNPRITPQASSPYGPGNPQHAPVYSHHEISQSQSPNTHPMQPSMQNSNYFGNVQHINHQQIPVQPYQYQQQQQQQQPLTSSRPQSPYYPMAQQQPIQQPIVSNPIQHYNSLQQESRYPGAETLLPGQAVPQNYRDNSTDNRTPPIPLPEVYGRQRSHTVGTVDNRAPTPTQVQHQLERVASSRPNGTPPFRPKPNLVSQRPQSELRSESPASVPATTQPHPIPASRPQSTLLPSQSARPVPITSPAPRSSFDRSTAEPSVSTTMSTSFSGREGGISPYPSNIGVSQSPESANSMSSASNQWPECAQMPTQPQMIQDIDPQLTLPLPKGITPINFVKMARPVFKYGGHISHPEDMSWSKVDRQVNMIRSVSLKVTPDTLAIKHVARPFSTPIDRVRAVFMWIANNIQYDSTPPKDNEDFDQNEVPNMVLQRRRSRGPGFAYLFHAMMDALGIDTFTIRGYLRQPLDQYSGAVLPEANHVWNAICLDGEYRLVDTASAAKSHILNAQSLTDPWFFLASPKEIIYTHYPIQASQQYLDPPVPLPVFWMLPYVRPTFFKSKTKLLNLPNIPKIELRNDEIRPLVLCLKDSTLGVFAEIELHDPNGSGRIVARQPLLAQCMNYKNKRMVKVLVGVRGGETRGLVKIYCGRRLALQPTRPTDDPPGSPGKSKMLGFLHSKDKRSAAGDYTRIKDVDEDGSIKTVATSKTYPLACLIPIVHTGRNNGPVFIQPNSNIPNEFYIKEPSNAEFRQGELVNFHLLPVGDERLFHVQLRSPSGHQFKFVYQPSDQGYILRHSPKERGAWIILYHTDTEGWLPIASYNCL